MGIKHLRPYRSSVIWSSWPGSNRHHTFIGRGLSAVELHEDGGRMWCRSTLPKDTALQAACQSRWLYPPKLEPPLGIKPRSARYQRAALSLCYGGMAENLGNDPNALRRTSLSRRVRQPYRLYSPLAEGGGVEPQTFRSPPVFRTGRHPRTGTFLMQLVPEVGFEPTLPSS